MSDERIENLGFTINIVRNFFAAIVQKANVGPKKITCQQRQYLFLFQHSKQQI
jgi:hypothetical protein